MEQFDSSVILIMWHICTLFHVMLMPGVFMCRGQLIQLCDTIAPTMQDSLAKDFLCTDLLKCIDREWLLVCSGSGVREMSCKILNFKMFTETNYMIPVANFITKIISIFVPSNQ